MEHFRIKYVFCYVIVLFFQCALYSQTSDTKGSSDILCKVVDQITKENIAFVTVSFVGLNNGVITDDEGNFRLPIIYKQQINNLLISCIGYGTKEVAVKDLSETSLNSIELKPQTLALDLVTVIAKKEKENSDFMSSISIVRQAVNRLQTNFPTTPHSYIAYYRDYQLVKNRYFNVNESILEVFDAGIQTNKLLSAKNQTVLYSYQTNTDFSVDENLNVPYGSEDSKFIRGGTISSLGGNELGLLNIHDAIRNYEYYSFSFIDILKSGFFENHLFMTSKDVFFDDKTLYEIGFYTLDDVVGTRNHGSGKIYISKNDFAIYKLEYYGYFKNDKKPLYSVKIEYGSKDNKMFLKYISFNNRFQIKNDGDFQVTDMSFDSAENALYLTFNTALDKNSIDEADNFKFDYKGKKLEIKTVSLISDFELKATIESTTLLQNELSTKEALENVSYKVRRLKDVAGRFLDKKSYIEVDQFRELFVQEHFTTKKLPKDAIFVNKYKQLNESKVNEKLVDDSMYWVNSPLKSMKEK